MSSGPGAMGLGRHRVVGQLLALGLSNDVFPGDVAHTASKYAAGHDAKNASHPRICSTPWTGSLRKTLAQPPQERRVRIAVGDLARRLLVLLDRLQG